MKIVWDELTPEQKAKAPEYVEYWAKVALSTGRMTPEERESVKANILKLYDLGDCERPKNVVIVPSPRMMAQVGGAAAWWWYTEGKKEGASKPTSKQIVALLESEGARECAKRWYSMYQGGNMWSGWLCLNSFARDVCGFKNESQEKFEVWEALAKVSGFRIIHEKFCVVSEKPIEYHTYVREDGEYVLHNEDGPAQLWADGFATYFIDGVSVPDWVVTNPERITKELIAQENNAEIQLIMRQRYPGGESAYLRDIGAKIIDLDSVLARSWEPNGPQICRALMEDDTGARFLIAGDGSTKNRTFVMRVPPETATCVEAERALTGVDPAKLLGRS